MSHYVIIGGGSGGAVLAARLTEDPATTVTLLEAGPSSDVDEVNIPAAFYTTWRSKWDWNYQITEQKQLAGRRGSWPRMKALGGCSSMNAMIYIRANPVDFDGWRDTYGAQGWAYEDVLPYFIKAEHNSRLSGPYHGTQGPLRVEDRRTTHPLSHAWVESAVESGMRRTDDFNGAEQEGAGQYQVTCHKGRRCSTEKAYLQPARGRANLTVITDALATRIVMAGGRAVGVAYRHQGEDHTAYAEAEVLLCGGAINSPQLLMLSGIGPGAHLRETGVDVVADLAGVGQNLQDHPLVPLIWKTTGTTDLLDLNTPANLARAKFLGRGPLVSNLAEAGGFWRSREDLPAPDLQSVIAPTGYWDNAERESNQRLVTVGTTLINVASRGQIRLRSTDPRWHPEIDPAYYDRGEDLDAITLGVRQTFDIATSGPLARMLGPAFMPSADDGRRVSDQDLETHIRATTQTLYHPVGTCAMGTGPDAVVDAQLKVHGIDGLRVVDASVMPEVPRGNTNAPTIMIAERAADLIRGRAPLPQIALARPTTRTAATAGASR
ncbi:GMC family oxidoreductase [Leekyejoonella antrihumi]|uniref:Choline dehydrogenase n=1 Tax=Leekyejoonella antrihumi TaxID=1660198 RepID=A0A563E8S8_9MICO|nr:GMC family oxidoreductase N-terminal domain-containing protein [Leekyejoonella antrihumi]TWP38622.1 choline dehydrogenase [Leekyejoonella antrihumi]